MIIKQDMATALFNAFLWTLCVYLIIQITNGVHSFSAFMLIMFASSLLDVDSGKDILELHE